MSRRSNFIQLFDMHVKLPLIASRRDIPPENLYSLMRPSKGTSLSQAASFEVSSIEIDWQVPEEGREKK
jgi:hypothetical protein